MENPVGVVTSEGHLYVPYAPHQNRQSRPCVWGLSKLRYWSVCVDFLYTYVTRKPLSPRETRVSKKGMDPRLMGTSMVNWMWGFKELTCKRNWQECSALWMMVVSTMWLCQILGGFGIVLMASVLHKQVGYQWAIGGTHGHTMYLCIILTMKFKEGTFKAELH